MYYSEINKKTLHFEYKRIKINYKLFSYFFVNVKTQQMYITNKTVMKYLIAFPIK